MSRSIRRTLILSIATVLLLSYATAFGGDVRNTQSTYGLKAGLVSPGTWFVGDFEYGPDMGYSLGGFLDYKLGEKITGGVYVDIHGINAYESSSSLFDFGITLKALIYNQTSKFTFKPGIGIGYGTLGKMDIYASTNYMVLKGFVDIVHSTPGGMSWLGEVGFWGSPDGGNDDFEAYFGTGLIVRGGIIF